MNSSGDIVCAGCRSAYSRGEWLGLSIVDTLTSRELRPYVLAWEEVRVIEVRACATCGRSMARATTRAA
jgi:RNA polymerase subunit RPABC4/transcription elongation factor Spt4